MSFQQNMVKQLQDQLTALKADKGLLASQAAAVKLGLEAHQVRQEMQQDLDEADFDMASALLEEKCNEADADQEMRMTEKKAFQGILANNGKMTPEEFKLFMMMIKKSREERKAALDSLKQAL